MTDDLMEISHWLASHPPSLSDIDCITAIQLKILDGKCKMPDIEKVIMSRLYSEISHLQGQALDFSLRSLIAEACQQLEVSGELSEEMTMHIYELRLLAESQISRPVMKAFKAHMRNTGLLPKKLPAQEKISA